MVAVTRSTMGWPLIRAIAIGMLAFAGACTACFAQGAPQDGENQIKAAFLYRFLHFVEWPPHAFEQPESPLVIGVLGADALAEDLTRLVAGRTVLGRPVVARRIRPAESVAGLQMLFVGRAESARLSTLSGWTKDQSLLIVSESDDAFAHGSAINFVVVENKVRFDVALGAAEQARLKISSRLLALARRVLPGLS
jgi:hypothetical protein